MARKKRKKQKRMGPGTILFLGIFGIFMFLFWLVVSYTLIKYFFTDYTFEGGKFHGFYISAKYVPFFTGALWFGGLFGVVEIFNEIKDWLKNKNK